MKWPPANDDFALQALPGYAAETPGIVAVITVITEDIDVALRHDLIDPRIVEATNLILDIAPRPPFPLSPYFPFSDLNKSYNFLI